MTMTKKADPVLLDMRVQDDDLACRLVVHGGLNYLRGNTAPYFSITGELSKVPDSQYRRDLDIMGGAIHNTIRKHVGNRFDDLIALHLSDIDGVPMHAEANGWYQLVGALGPDFARDQGVRYHAGNAERQHWTGEFGETFDGFRISTTAECMDGFVEHCRISIAEAYELAYNIRSAGPEARLAWAAAAEAMKPRWKAEADACIARHGLVVYGDHWAG